VYTVQAGDHHLGVIVKRYNDEKIPVTMRSIMNANPTVDWNRLKIGQKINIPKPK
jgi:LysM repeat protein